MGEVAVVQWIKYVPDAGVMKPVAVFVVDVSTVVEVLRAGGRVTLNDCGSAGRLVTVSPCGTH